MTPEQKANYNSMIAALRKVYQEYPTSHQVYLRSPPLEYENNLAAKYDRIQFEAEKCVKGIRRLK